MTKLRFAACVLVVTMTTASAEEPLDYDMINKIMDEGFNRSYVMDTVHHLTDTIGPRLTNSPAMRQAAQWTRDEMNRFGLSNARLEPFSFGRGWSYDSVIVHMTEPRRMQLSAMPIAWHPGTDGLLEAGVIAAPIDSAAALEGFKEEHSGKLAGKIVLISRQRPQDEPSDPVFTRYNDEQLGQRETFPIPNAPSRKTFEFFDNFEMKSQLADFLADEGALAMVERSRKDGGLLAAEGYRYREGLSPRIPGIIMASEDYDRLIRLVDSGSTVAMSIYVIANYHDDDMNAQNVLADIPGQGSKPEVVMAGAHLDSWHMSDGAVDNATGVAVVMEAGRILAAIGAKAEAHDPAGVVGW